MESITKKDQNRWDGQLLESSPWEKQWGLAVSSHADPLYNIFLIAIFTLTFKAHM